MWIIRQMTRVQGLYTTYCFFLFSFFSYLLLQVTRVLSFILSEDDNLTFHSSHNHFPSIYHTKRSLPSAYQVQSDDCQVLLTVSLLDLVLSSGVCISQLLTPLLFIFHKSPFQVCLQQRMTWILSG